MADDIAGCISPSALGQFIILLAFFITLLISGSTLIDKLLDRLSERFDEPLKNLKENMDKQSENSKEQNRSLNTLNLELQKIAVTLTNMEARNKDWHISNSETHKRLWDSCARYDKQLIEHDERIKLLETHDQKGNVK